MPTREQLTHERLDALIEVLQEQTNLTLEWAETLRSTAEIGDADEIKRAAREGTGPPDLNNR